MPADITLSGPHERRKSKGSRYGHVLRSHGGAVKEPSQKQLEKAYKRVGTTREKKYDDLVGKDDKGKYYLD
jgi:hypothetical protein